MLAVGCLADVVSPCLCRNRGTEDAGAQEATWPGLLLTEASVRAITGCDIKPKLFSGHALKLEKPCVSRAQPFLFSHWLLKPHTAWLVDGHQGEPSL